MDAKFVHELELVDAVVGLHDDFQEEAGNNDAQSTPNVAADENTSPPHHQSVTAVEDASERDRVLTSYSPEISLGSTRVLPTTSAIGIPSPTSPNTGDSLGAPSFAVIFSVFR